MIRPLIVLVLIAGLTACGFHLRTKLALPPDVPAVKVVSTSQYSELSKLIKRNLWASRVPLADEDAKSGFAQLKVLSERWGDRSIAIDAEGRSQEYSLRYAVVFTMLAPDGSVLVPQQVIEMSRDYVSPPTNATGTVTEREMLVDELQRDMAASILRRIDIVVRARLEHGQSLKTGTAPATSASPTEPTEPVK